MNVKKLEPYLNFSGTCEEAMNFYKKVFKVDDSKLIIYKMNGMPNAEQLPAEDLDKIMHASLQVGQSQLMGADVPSFMMDKFSVGSNVYINIEPDSKEEADRVYKELSEGGIIEMPLEQQFFGYFACFVDKYKVKWMINYENK